MPQTEKLRLYKGVNLRVWGLVDLMEDLGQVIFARDGNGKFQNLEVEFTVVRLLLFGTPLSIFR